MPASQAEVWSLAAGTRRSGALEDELDRRARDLATIHRAERDPLGWQLRWGFIPWPVLERSHCVFCGRQWLCPPAAWAQGRLTALGSLGLELSEEGS